MKCYKDGCINNNEWACMYRDECNECNRGCKHYYQCDSCDYYMDEDIADDEYEDEWYEDEYDSPYENEMMKFIWGVKSWDDFTYSDACLYTMNDIDLLYLKDQKKYLLGIETIFCFEKEEHKLGYLESCLDAFTKFMVANGYNTEVKPHWWNVFGKGMSEYFDSIEECYGMFKLLVDGYCNHKGVSVYE